MTTSENILINDELNPLQRSGEIYFKEDSFIKLIELCCQNNIALIGIEGFEVDGEKIIPVADLIADFSDADANSWDEYIKICNSSAKLFFDQVSKGSNLLFNFTLQSEEEWSSK
jgi:hypothetical protein